MRDNGRVYCSHEIRAGIIAEYFEERSNLIIYIPKESMRSFLCLTVVGQLSVTTKLRTIRLLFISLYR